MAGDPPIRLERDGAVASIVENPRLNRSRNGACAISR
jgi:hypothetical protein